MFCAHFPYHHHNHTIQQAQFERSNLLFQDSVALLHAMFLNNLILKLAVNLGDKAWRSPSASSASGWCLSLPWIQVESKSAERKQICAYMCETEMKEEKYRSRKDGLLVRSARESIANEVRRDDDENTRCKFLQNHTDPTFNLSPLFFQQIFNRCSNSFLLESIGSTHLAYNAPAIHSLLSVLFRHNLP